MIDSEDSLSLQEFRNKKKSGELDIAVIQLPYASNISDIEPFFFEEDVSLRFVRNAGEFGYPDAVIIPGTKSTIRDLQFLKKEGLFEKIADFSHGGGFVTGICGGYQMLGTKLIDEEGTDTGVASSTETGLGLIDSVTYFRKEKQTIRVKGSYHPHTGIGKGVVEGYEIHLGETKMTEGAGKSPLFLFDDDREEGFYSKDGRIVGTYLHHLYHNDGWRHYWLNEVRRSAGLPEREKVDVGAMKDGRYDRLAEEMGAYLDWEKVKQIVMEWGTQDENH